VSGRRFEAAGRSEKIMLPVTERPLPFFQRAALLVDDLDKALAVYRDLLGFELEYVGDDESDSFTYEIFEIPESVQTRFAALSSQSQQRTLALIEAPGHAAAQNERRTATVIQVDSVPAILAGATALGLDICKPRTELDPRKGPPRTESGFYDHDGHTVVIYNLE
jgi:catechol 2,3-dioxygenase-like lactoylglutathione lyase family enzyme